MHRATVTSGEDQTAFLLKYDGADVFIRQALMSHAAPWAAAVSLKDGHTPFGSEQYLIGT